MIASSPCVPSRHLAVAACQDSPAPNAEDSPTASVALAKASPALIGSPTERAEQIVTRVNARLEAAGSTIRLDEVWMFSLGAGTDPFSPASHRFALGQSEERYVLDR